MERAAVIFTIILACVYGEGLVDDPIGAAGIQYLDSGPSSSSSWVASTSGQASPAGCSFDAGAVDSSALLAPVLESGQLVDVPTREACCTRCWSEALCVSSLHSSASGGMCLLQAAASSGADTVIASKAMVASGAAHKKWTLCQPKRAGPPLNLQIPASVPGDLLSDLQRAGQIGDPYYEKNFLNSSLWNSHTWSYSTTFTPTELARAHLRAAGGRVLLVFDGLKMGARVYLDGSLLGMAADQFLRYR